MEMNVKMHKCNYETSHNALLNVLELENYAFSCPVRILDTIFK